MLKIYIIVIIYRDIGIIDSIMWMMYFVVWIDDFYVLNGDKMVVKFGFYGIVVFKGKVLENVYWIL